MKKVIFGIFAHPDDEAFGPSAYLHREAEKGVDVHLVLVTDGAAGRNEGYDDLAATRLAEWQESGRRMGAISFESLNYPDGSLCNNVYHEISDKIQRHIDKTLTDYIAPVELHFVTFEERGVSGHLDHIAVSYMTTYLLEKMKQSKTEGINLGQLHYYCLPKELQPECNCDWIFMPEGRHSDEIHERVSYADIADRKIHIMQAHVSQKKDMNYILGRHGHFSSDMPESHNTDHFILRY